MVKKRKIDEFAKFCVAILSLLVLLTFQKIRHKQFVTYFKRRKNYSFYLRCGLLEVLSKGHEPQSIGCLIVVVVQYRIPNVKVKVLYECP